MSQQSYKRYQCAECGHIENIVTNHYGPCYGVGDYNQCKNRHLAPPSKRYPQVVIRKNTEWLCLGAGSLHIMRNAMFIERAGRFYGVTAIASANDFELINDFLLSTEGQSVLSVDDGIVYIVPKVDLGSNVVEFENGGILRINKSR